MSVYRSFKRAPRSDVHHVADHAASPKRSELASAREAPRAQDWSDKRKAAPPEALFPATEVWMSLLPFDLRPETTAATFPRIANALAALWSRPDALTAYLGELLVDRRGGRRGFPIKVLRELHALRAHYASLHPRRDASGRRAAR